MPMQEELCLEVIKCLILVVGKNMYIGTKVHRPKLLQSDHNGQHIFFGSCKIFLGTSKIFCYMQFVDHPA